MYHSSGGGDAVPQTNKTFPCKTPRYSPNSTKHIQNTANSPPEPLNQKAAVALPHAGEEEPGPLQGQRFAEAGGVPGRGQRARDGEDGRPDGRLDGPGGAQGSWSLLNATTFGCSQILVRPAGASGPCGCARQRAVLGDTLSPFPRSCAVTGAVKGRGLKFP